MTSTRSNRFHNKTHTASFVKNKTFLRTLFCLSILIAVCVGKSHGWLLGIAVQFALAALIPVQVKAQLGACWANNFGVLNNTILVNDAFDDLVSNLPPILKLVTDVTSEAGGRYAKPGETITVKDWTADFQAYNVTSALGYLAPDYIGNPPATVTLPNQAKAISFTLTAEEYRLLSSGAQRTTDGYTTFLGKIKNKMNEGLGKAIIADYHAMIDAAAYSHYLVTAPGTFTRGTEVDIDTDLFSRKIYNSTGPCMVLSPAAYGEWAKDHLIIQNHTGENESPRLMDSGVRSLVSNFNVYRTNVAMPLSAPRGYAATKSAAVFVNRIPDEPSAGETDPVSLAEVVNTNTGLAVLARLWKNAQKGSIQMDIALLYAFAKGQDAALERLIPAAPAQ